MNIFITGVSSGIGWGLFPSVQKLLDARTPPSMPKAEAAATKLAWGIDQLDNLPTGSYADIRTMSLS